MEKPSSLDLWAEGLHWENNEPISNEILLKKVEKSKRVVKEDQLDIFESQTRIDG